MNNQMQFQEKLAKILKAAQNKDMRISKEEIEREFAADNLTHVQLELVYDYLLSQKVAVKGYIKQDPTNTTETASQTLALTSEEETYLKEYLSTLPPVEKETATIREILFKQAVQGDALGKSKLLESYLYEVVNIARSMKTPEVLIEDLIQEGNISLMLSIDQITELSTPEEIKEEIRAGIQAYIEESTDIKHRDESLVNKVKDIDETITELNESLGRKITIEELAQYLDMTEEQVSDILKLAEDV